VRVTSIASFTAASGNSRDIASKHIEHRTHSFARSFMATLLDHVANNLRLTYNERFGLLREKKGIQLLFRKDKANCEKKHYKICAASS
jgi:hypothetical protein